MEKKVEIKLLQYAPALVIYSYIILNAAENPASSLLTGEAVIDIKETIYGVTPKQCRIAIEKLKEWELCEFRTDMVNGRVRTIGRATKHLFKGPPVKEKKRKATAEPQAEVPIYRAFQHLKITVDDYNKLLHSWEKHQVDEILDRIENYKNNTNYSSLFLTAKNWLGKYPKKKGSKYTEHQIKEAKMWHHAGMGLPDYFDKEDIELIL